MRLGFIGAGNMGSALARGIGEPALVFDLDPARAGALAEAVGGEVRTSGREVAEEADVVVLCHKPKELREVAGQLDGAAPAVASILGGTAVADLEATYPDVPVYRFMPNLAAEVRQGVLCYVPGRRAGEGPEAELLDLFGRAGRVVALPEPLVEPATALMGCGPAFFALVVEALVDAGVRRGLPPDEASALTVETMAGTAALLRDSGWDTFALRRRVTSPGGSTARGLAALERGGVRAAMADAVDAVADMGRA